MIDADGIHLVVAVERTHGARDVPTNKSITQWTRSALAAAATVREPVAVVFRIVDEDEMRELNAGYRGKAYATNVLSFAADLPSGVLLPERPLGDIAICTSVVVREAGEFGCRLRHRWAHMVIHGVLHLLGFDHEAPAEAIAMEAMERRILAGLGMPDPYG